MTEFERLVLQSLLILMYNSEGHFSYHHLPSLKAKMQAMLDADSTGNKASDKMQ